jgi:peptide/nickel transport system substrate-binding protein
MAARGFDAASTWLDRAEMPVLASPPSMEGRMRGLVWTAAVALGLAATLGGAAQAQKKDAIVVGMPLEPPGLDPTTGAAAAISEVTLYNLFEGLTKITGEGKVQPLLAESWDVAADARTYTFKLRKDAKFHDGKPLTSADVKFIFERNGGEKSQNKRKLTYQNMAAVETPDPHTVVLKLTNPAPNLLFELGEATAVILAQETAAKAATEPVGTGPFKLERWVKGDSVVLAKVPDHRLAAQVRLNRVTFKFINDAQAQTTAVLAGDVDAFPLFRSVENIAQVQANKSLAVDRGWTEGETILGINNKKKPLDDIRVRRAIAHTIDRKAIIDGAMEGYGTPIGSHFPPHHPDYVDLVNRYPLDISKAKALLAEAGFPNGLDVSLKLPPVAYARNGGQIIAQQLGKAGIRAKIENVEWAQWLDVVYKQKNYDLTIVSHVEPNDMVIYEDTSYYFQYDNNEFRDIMKVAKSALDPKERSEALKTAQRKLADDAVNGYLFMLAKTGVRNAKLKGLWTNAPIFANDMTIVSWE